MANKAQYVWRSKLAGCLLAVHGKLPSRGSLIRATGLNRAAVNSWVDGETFAYYTADVAYTWREYLNTHSKNRVYTEGDIVEVVELVTE